MTSKVYNDVVYGGVQGTLTLSSEGTLTFHWQRMNLTISSSEMVKCTMNKESASTTAKIRLVIQSDSDPITTPQGEGNNELETIYFSHHNRQALVDLFYEIILARERQNRSNNKKISSSSIWATAEDANGDTYYYHKKTGQATWERPPDYYDVPVRTSKKSNHLNLNLQEERLVSTQRISSKPPVPPPPLGHVGNYSHRASASSKTATTNNNLLSSNTHPIIGNMISVESQVMADRGGDQENPEGGGDDDFIRTTKTSRTSKTSGTSLTTSNGISAYDDEPSGFTDLGSLGEEGEEGIMVGGTTTMDQQQQPDMKTTNKKKLKASKTVPVPGKNIKGGTDHHSKLASCITAITSTICCGLGAGFCCLQVCDCNKMGDCCFARMGDCCTKVCDKLCDCDFCCCCCD